MMEQMINENSLSFKALEQDIFRFCLLEAVSSSWGFPGGSFNQDTSFCPQWVAAKYKLSNNPFLIH